MKKSIYFICCLLFSLANYGQDTINHTLKKTYLSIQVGGCYNTFLGGKYIEPTPKNLSDKFQDHQYERFTKKPTFGFSAGVLFTYKIKECWGLVSGLLYFSRNDIYENKQDTVIKYGNRSSIRDIRNTLKYDYSNNSFELPIMLLYKKGAFNFYAGAYISLLNYKKTNYTYVIYQFPNEPNWTISDKTIEGFEIPLTIYPAIDVSYNIKIKNKNINPFIGFFYGINNQNSFTIHFGINYSF